MVRSKTFDATGVAPGGRLFAGDLNLIQDLAAALSDFAQLIDVSALRISNPGLSLLAFSATELWFPSWLRVTGILRAIGGFVGGSYTTAQRDAIAAGSRPYGLTILNTDLNRYEFNSGTDAVPNWQPVSAQQTGQVLRAQLETSVLQDLVPVGAEIDWAYSEAQRPPKYEVQDGVAISRSTYAGLNAKAAASGYPDGAGDGSTTFNKPDMRGRVGVGKDDMGGAAAGRISAGNNGTTLGGVHGSETSTLSIAHLPSHDHGGITGSDNIDHSHGGTTGNQSTGFSITGVASFKEPASGTTVNYYVTSFISDAHAHAFGTGGRSALHQHGISLQGGGTGHPNLQPGRIKNKLIKVL